MTAITALPTDAAIDPFGAFAANSIIIFMQALKIFFHVFAAVGVVLSVLTALRADQWKDRPKLKKKFTAGCILFGVGVVFGVLFNTTVRLLLFNAEFSTLTFSNIAAAYKIAVVAAELTGVILMLAVLRKTISRRKTTQQHGEDPPEN